MTSEIIISELKNASIRTTEDGRHSVYDVITIASGRKNPHQILKGLREKHPEVLQKMENFAFLGQGQRETPVATKENCLYIIGLLPGFIGKKYREEAAKLVIRYINADITLADEVVQRNDDDRKLAWLEKRIKGKRKRNELTATLKAHGVEGAGYAKCTNATYTGLYGTTAQGLKKRDSLPEKANWRDSASEEELFEIAFTEDLTSRRIRKTGVRGNDPCADTCLDTAEKLRGFVSELLEA